MLSSKVILALGVLLLVSPLFGVIMAEVIGYHEPLDLVAEELGLSELEVEWTPLRDYTFPGLPDWLGYIISGALGLLLILLTGYVLRLVVVGRV
ncbi:MAG: PDGLE domain-containing protein [Zestosphaera sp.]